MSDVFYVSKARIERKAGPLRIAHIPEEQEEVYFSVHGVLAEHEKVERSKLIGSHASTIDYVVAAVGSEMLGTFATCLERRFISAANGRLAGEAAGEVEIENGVLVLRRICVSMTLSARISAHPLAEHIHKTYPMKCPLFRSLRKAIKLSSSLELLPLGHATPLRHIFAKPGSPSAPLPVSAPPPVVPAACRP